MLSSPLRRQSPVGFFVVLLVAPITGLIANWAFAGSASPARDVASPLTAHEATTVLAGESDLEPWRPYRIDLAPAKWIWLPAERTLSNTFVLFRKEFDLPSEPIAATGWIAADSRYKLTVNGNRVQWGPAPCDPRSLDADPIDLKPVLRAGKNVIGVEVLFYGLGDGTWPGGKPGLILNLDVQTAQGQVQVVTDGTWRALLDRAHPPGQYKRWFLRAMQEQFDARLYPHGWNGAALLPMNVGLRRGDPVSA